MPCPVPNPGAYKPCRASLSAGRGAAVDRFEDLLRCPRLSGRCLRAGGRCPGRNLYVRSFTITDYQEYRNHFLQNEDALISTVYRTQVRKTQSSEAKRNMPSNPASRLFASCPVASPFPPVGWQGSKFRVGKFPGWDQFTQEPHNHFTLFRRQSLDFVDDWLRRHQAMTHGRNGRSQAGLDHAWQVSDQSTRSRTAVQLEVSSSPKYLAVAS